MLQDNLMRMVSTTIEVLCNSMNSWLINLPRCLGSNVQNLLVLAEWYLPNLLLAIAWELACRICSNYKLEYLTMYRSN